MQFFKKLFYKPISTRLKVTSSNGFHLRPIGKFTHQAKQFEAVIEADFREKRVDAKSVSALLSLSLDKEDSFRLFAQGKDARKALDVLEKLFHKLMSEEVAVKEVPKQSHEYEGKSIQGEIISKGIAIASLAHYSKTQSYQENTCSFEEAIEQSMQSLSHNPTDIDKAQKTLLISLYETSKTLKAFEASIRDISSTLQGTKNASKITDYQDIKQRVKSYLGFKTSTSFPKEDFILLADDLLPSEIELLTQSKVHAVILQNNSIYSHTAILLKSVGITSMIIQDEILTEGEKIILDSYAGVILGNPSSHDIKKAKDRQEEKEKETQSIASKRFDKAMTKSHEKISVYANVTDTASAKIAKEEGAEGIGLLRSEFLFRDTKPSLEIQIQSYKEIFALFEDITVRTLDVGGDKALPYIKIEEENNPFLGIRGIRLFKTHAEIIKEQLQAIFLASQTKAIKIMFPMVSSVEEFVEAKAFAQEVAKKYDLDISSIQFGIMIEVPSVLFLLEDFNKVVDFYSIGSNDLAQYLFAIERTHPLLKIDPLSAVVFSSIEHIMKNASKPVSICGELASNEEAIAKLIKLGLKTLSVSAKSIALTKKIIRES
jgi:phosphocarrier protein FPr